MNRIIDLIVSVVFLVPWLAGIVFAKGTGSTILAVIFPPWAYYLVIEFVINRLL